eukprot:jgi/Bigna1/68275/fgenesh1_pg.5_\
MEINSKTRRWRSVQRQGTLLAAVACVAILSATIHNTSPGKDLSASTSIQKRRRIADGGAAVGDNFNGKNSPQAAHFDFRTLSGTEDALGSLLKLRGGDSFSHRRENFKPSVDAQQARRDRYEALKGLTNQKRQEAMNKKRAVFNRTQPSSGADGAGTAQSNEPPVTLQDLPRLVQSLKSSTVEERLSGARNMRKLLSNENPPADAAVEKSKIKGKLVGALQPLVEALKQTESTELQFEAAWALTNIASTDFTKQVVYAGAVEPLVGLLTSQSADVREQSAWCLGNVAGDCAELRDTVIRAGAVEPILANVRQPESLSLLRNTIWAMSNLCRGKPGVQIEVARQVMPVLANTVMLCSDEDTLIDACWAFSYLTDGENERIDLLVEHKPVVQALVKHLHSKSSSLIAPVLQTLGNVINGTDEQTQVVMDSGILSHLLQLLQHPKKSLRKETCWLISNIAAGGWGVVVELGAIKPLCELLTASDPNLVSVVLSALESILQVSEENGLDYDERLEDAEGLDKLEELQGHKNEDIYLKAVSILERYFPAGEEDVGED